MENDKDSKDLMMISIYEYKSICKEIAKKEFLEEAIKADIPGEYLKKMLSDGINAELKKSLYEYKETGLTPKQIREIDVLYSELAKENADLKSMIEELNEKLNDGKKEKTTQAEEPKPEKVRIDKGKILALKKAGWRVKDIAEEMKLKEATVSNILYRENLKLKEAEAETE